MLASAAALLAFAVSVGITIRHIATVSGKVPLADDYGTLALADKWYSATLTFADVFTPHNGHPMFIARSIFLADVALTHLDLHVLGYWSVAIMAVIAAMVFISMPATDEDQLSTRLLWFVPVVALMFSLRQWETWLTGMQIIVCLMVALVVGAIFSMQKSIEDESKLGVYYWLSILSAVMATLTWGAGMLVWPSLTVQLVLGGWRERRARLIGVVGAGAIAALSYPLISGVAGSMRATGLAGNPLDALYILDVHLGNPVVGEFANHLVPSVSAAFGVAFAGIEIYALSVHLRARQDKRVQGNMYVAFMAYALLVAMALTLSRFDFGFQQGFSRYSTFTLLGPIGALLLLWLYRRRTQTVYAVLVFAVGLSLVGVTRANVEESRMALDRKTYGDNLLQVMKRDGANASNDALAPFQNKPDVVRAGILVMQKHKLGPYYEKETPLD